MPEGRPSQRAPICRPLLVIVDLDFLGVFTDIRDKILLDLVASTASHTKDEVVKRRPPKNVDMVAWISSQRVLASTWIQTSFANLCLVLL